VKFSSLVCLFVSPVNFFVGIDECSITIARQPKRARKDGTNFSKNQFSSPNKIHPIDFANSTTKKFVNSVQWKRVLTETRCKEKQNKKN
jgi:hypothetical protein